MELRFGEQNSETGARSRITIIGLRGWFGHLGG
jgi:hypothetical protein